jgi:hypothetical protein
MNVSYKHLLPEDFDKDSRVWIYQSDRLFTIAEALEIEPMLENFSSSWQSHGTPVKGFATMFFGRFIILMADETATGVSGCSTDSSVRLIKEIEQKFKVNMFNRQLLAFVVKDKVELLPLSQLDYGFEHGFVTRDTIYFNNTVLTKEQLINNWMIPVENSWLKSRLLNDQAIK